MSKNTFISAFKKHIVYGVLAVCALVTVAHAAVDKFTVVISGVATTEDYNFTPCYPITGEFYHPDPNVTRVRMEYPNDPAKFFMYPVNQKVHIDFHEQQMKRGDNPYSDFVAEDDYGLEYGRIRMIFWAPDPKEDNECRNANTS
ncbi:MAG: hypothetical protein JKY71_08175 [Alphaproteobacteria bacterium]|nr:hypothetical protein [Alphaproteobacteria bacterium]